MTLNETEKRLTEFARELNPNPSISGQAFCDRVVRVVVPGPGPSPQYQLQLGSFGSRQHHGILLGSNRDEAEAALRRIYGG